MSEQNIKLVGLDIDGTLLNSHGQITPHTREVIVKCIESGCRVIPATGRPLLGIPDAFLQIPGVEYAVTANGASVVRVDSGEFILKYWLSREMVEQAFRKTAGLYRVFDVFTEGSGYSQAENLAVAEEWAPRNMAAYMRKSRRPVEDIEEFISQQQGFEKCTMFFMSEEKRQKAREVLGQMGCFEVVASESNNLEISAKGVHKGIALLGLGELLGLEKNQVMACGDSENDLEMLRAVGLGVAMANAALEIRSQADVVTASNDEDGVALALERFVLGAGK